MEDPERVTEMQPADYAETLDALKRRVHDARFTLQRRANAELLDLYWHIGDTILARQRSSGWGSEVVARLGEDLRAEFPTLRGLSGSDLSSMLAFAAAWPRRVGIVQQPVGQLPWTHVVALLNELDDQALREWYAGKDVQHTWSRGTLSDRIAARLHESDAEAPSNFRAALSRPDSELAHQLTSDPYTRGFLGVDSGGTGIETEERLTAAILRTLRGSGSGIAFVGRQQQRERQQREGDGDDCFVDLLFFHVEQLRYVVVQLVTRAVGAGDAGSLLSSVALVDDRVRLTDRHAPTVGVLLAVHGTETVFRYAPAGGSPPVAVSRDQLSATERAALPEEEMLAGLAAEMLVPGVLGAHKPDS
jgi:predicted nuclease of restriction endonuclease-like (RecB) superfamily